MRSYEGMKLSMHLIGQPYFLKHLAEEVTKLDKWARQASVTMSSVENTNNPRAIVVGGVGGNLGVHDHSGSTQGGNILRGITARPLVLPSNVPLTVQGLASQTANLIDLKDSAGTILTLFTKDGYLGIGGAPTGETALLVTKTSASVAVTRNLVNFVWTVSAAGSGATLTGCLTTLSVSQNPALAAITAAYAVQGVVSWTGGDSLAGSGAILGALNGTISVDSATQDMGQLIGCRVSVTSFSSASCDRFEAFVCDNNWVLAAGKSIAEFMHFSAPSPKVTNGSGITDLYGLRVFDFAGAGTNRWGVHVAGSATPNYFRGKVGLNQTAPSARLDVVMESGTDVGVEVNLTDTDAFGKNNRCIYVTASLDDAVDGVDSGHAVHVELTSQNSFENATAAIYARNVATAGVGFPDTGSTYAALLFSAETAGSEGLGSMAGVQGDTTHNSTGTLLSQVGGKFTLRTGTTAGDVTGADGVLTQANLQANYTNFRGVRVTAPTISGHTITNLYGVQIEDHGIAGATNKWGLYVLGANTPNYFRGKVGINKTAPGAMLDIVIDSASTVGQITQGAASQTGDLSQWKDNAGTVLSRVVSDGRFGIRTTPGTGTRLEVLGDGSNAAVILRSGGDGTTGTILHCFNGAGTPLSILSVGERWVSGTFGAGAAIHVDVSDVTKKFVFDASFIATASTRNFHVPDFSGRLVTRSDSEVSLTGQTASIGTTTIRATTEAIMHRISVYAMCTTAGSAGTLDVVIGWTDSVGATTETVITGFSLSATGRAKAALAVRCTNGSNITYATTVTGASGSPQYALYVTVEGV